MAPCVGLRVQSYCFLSNPPNFFAIIFQKINNCDKNGCEGWAWRLRGAYLRHAFLDISAIPAPRISPRPRVAQPNIPCEVVARLRTTSGVRFCWGISFPACRHAPAWRNTGLRTAAIPCRGLRLPRLSTAPPRSQRRSHAPLHCAAAHLRYSHARFHCAASKRVPPQEGAKKACTGARLSYEKNLLIMNCYLIVLIALVVPSVKVVTTMFTPSNGLSERCPIMLTYSTDLTSFSTASSLNVPSTPVPSCVPKR